MLKKYLCLILFFWPLAGWAEPDANEDLTSNECLRSMRDIYKFYYYEIQPNPRNENCQSAEKLTSAETLQMQVVIGELKKHCSERVIARINENLKSDLATQETASS